MLAEAKRHRLDLVVCWRLDRLGRSIKHLTTLIDELQARVIDSRAMSAVSHCV